MVERAQAGRTVVRLKGGDPFVFGRGGEEALALRAAGIPFESCPASPPAWPPPPTRASPSPTAAWPSAVALITGHEDPDKPESAIDWPALAAFPGTLVFYMGVRQLPHIAASLIAAGRAASEPAAIVERGTLPDQRTVTGTLATIAERAQARGIAGALDHRRGRRRRAGRRARMARGAPLSGRTVAVTRARASSQRWRDGWKRWAPRWCRRRRSASAPILDPPDPRASTSRRTT